MGASTVASISWDAHADAMERSVNKLNSYAGRKWVKMVLPLNEWVAAVHTPGLAAQASGLPYTWTLEASTSDAITILVDLPNNLDRSQAIRFQALFSMETANKNPDIVITYKELAPGDDHAAADTALTTTIPVATDGAANDDSMLRETYVGEIAGSTLESDEEMLVVRLAITDDDTTTDKYELWSVRMWYQRLLL